MHGLMGWWMKQVENKNISHLCSIMKLSNVDIYRVLSDAREALRIVLLREW